MIQKIIMFLSCFAMFILSIYGAEQKGIIERQKEIITHCLVYSGYDNFNTDNYRFFCGWVEK